jgi:ABC-type amino acid transport substrate-binding protein
MPCGPARSTPLSATRRCSIRLLDIVFEPQEYAFVLPSGSELRKPLSVAILDAIQSEEWTEMKIRYLGPAAANSP